MRVMTPCAAQVGARLGLAGAFSGLDNAQLLAVLTDRRQHTHDAQQRMLQVSINLEPLNLAVPI